MSVFIMRTIYAQAYLAPNFESGCTKKDPRNKAKIFARLIWLLYSVFDEMLNGRF